MFTQYQIYLQYSYLVLTDEGEHIFSNKYYSLAWKFCQETQGLKFVKTLSEPYETQLSSQIRHPLLKKNLMNWSEFHKIYVPHLLKSKENVAILTRNDFFAYSQWFQKNRNSENNFLLRKGRTDSVKIITGSQQIHIVSGKYYPLMEKINLAILQIEVMYR